MKKWYAILMDREDNDWGTGSYDLEEAIEKAIDMEAISIAVIEEGPDPVCIDEIFIYDSFRVSAVFEDGATIDNNIVHEVGTDAVNRELDEAREWFKEQGPENYMISYYLNGECIAQEETK